MLAHQPHLTRLSPTGASRIADKPGSSRRTPAVESVCVGASRGIFCSIWPQDMRAPLDVCDDATRHDSVGVLCAVVVSRWLAPDENENECVRQCIVLCTARTRRRFTRPSTLALANVDGDGDDDNFASSRVSCILPRGKPHCRLSVRVCVCVDE